MRVLTFAARGPHHPLRLSLPPFSAWMVASVGGLVALAWWMARAPHVGADAYAYWYFPSADPYSGVQTVVGLDAFRYTPPIALVLLPFHELPFPVFYGMTLIANASALVYLARRWALAALLLPPVLIELEFGNIDLILAAVAVAGLRRPGLWAFAWLTKVTPGIGLLWFAVRRERRSLALGLGMTAALVALAAIVRPDLWPSWIAAMRRSLGTQPIGALYLPIPLPLRLAGAVALIVFGARTGRIWTMPFAVMLALPTLWFAATAMLVGTLRVERTTVSTAQPRKWHPKETW